MDARLPNQSDNELIREQVEAIVASGVLGRSRFYTALLQYLAECGERGHVPKEIEIAVEVFDRRDGFDPSQDSMVRVYAHNLRQKLQQYYAEQGTDAPRQVAIPKGEYRLTLETEIEKPDEFAQQSLPRSRLGLAAIVLVSLLAGFVLDRIVSMPSGSALAAYQDVAESALWMPITANDTPVTVVVGDYYIFGEFDEFGNIGRLVREFAINSSSDLDNWFMLEPDNADRYVDLELTYLPSSIAFAMRDLVGVLTAADKDIRVTSMSNFDTATIRETHVVYLGYLSGLGMLSDFLFANSDLEVGETFDELIHEPSGRTFTSEAGLPSDAGRYRDYGLFSALPAPGGNRFVFIAGTRDEGLMETAQAVTDGGLVRASIDAISENGVMPPAYELLYEVSGLGRTSLDATIVYSATRKSDRISIGQLAN